jgi:hypothetical protein
MDLAFVAFVAILGIAQLLYLAVMTTLGARLLKLSMRTQQLPEALLAIHFLLCCSLGYLLLIVGLSGAREPELFAPAVVSLLLGVGYLVSCIGVFGGIWFNFLVFRSKAGWARVLLALTGAALFAGYFGYGLGGGFQHGRMEGGWFWLFYGTYLAGAAWVMWEPLAYYRVMRRRLHLGLAEPLVVNRFLLWGIGSVGRFVMVGGGIIATVALGGQKTELAPDPVGFLLLAVALIGTGVAASYWLTFFPPPRYARFIERRSRQSLRSWG